jgi:hypothetical protein
MQDHHHGQDLDSRHPVEIAGGQQQYTDLEHEAEAKQNGSHKRHSLDGLKRRIGSLRRRKD